MTLATLGEVAGILAALAAVITLYVAIRGEARKRAQQELAERAELAGAKFAEGAISRNDEVALVKSQRDDARRERDELKAEYRREVDAAKADARQWQERYMDLRDPRR